jgi:hypothetical protein
MVVGRKAAWGRTHARTHLPTTAATKCVMKTREMGGGGGEGENKGTLQQQQTLFIDLLPLSRGQQNRGSRGERESEEGKLSILGGIHQTRSHQSFVACVH